MIFVMAIAMEVMDIVFVMKVRTIVLEIMAMVMEVIDILLRSKL